MNVSMPSEIRQLVKQGAISTAALERESIDDSAWIVRAVCEKLLREWDSLGLGEPVPELVRELASQRTPRREGFAPRVPVALSLAG
jgi:hypothetical protein